MSWMIRYSKVYERFESLRDNQIQILPQDLDRPIRSVFTRKRTVQESFA